MQLIDSHCHLDAPGVDHVVALSQMRAAQARCALIAGYGPERHAEATRLCAEHACLRRAVGLHPWWIAANLAAADDAWRLVREQAVGADVVALGEIGLDAGCRKTVSAQAQRRYFAGGLRVANECALPVILHVVGWHGHALQELASEVPRNGGVVHRFGGSLETIPQYLALGLSLSLDVITFQRSAALTLERASKIPLDRLLVETDWPQPGQSYAEALAALRDLVCALARHRGLSEVALAEQLAENAAILFNWPECGAAASIP